MIGGQKPKIFGTVFNEEVTDLLPCSGDNNGLLSLKLKLKQKPEYFSHVLFGNIIW